MRCLLMVILMLGISGCGTMANLAGKEYAFMSPLGERPVRIYGGLRNDIEWVGKGIGIPEADGNTSSDLEKRQVASIAEDPVGLAVGVPIFGFFAVVDPILSFIGDTATLPLTLPYAMYEMRESGGDSRSDLTSNP